ncbi:hypothetical protein EDB81DRAFT_925359 [Dactylonectria macrodidyma]|uniref:Uncharacterized protein n=1 Tax=Dactylonectria macrodidyma TaxID=307937 RepID=A0A9P9FH46_9HYPO|nr:hypothetical protein EDB81DRAFT_925359 [Dactylonectria macrodidyma]
MDVASADPERTYWNWELVSGTAMRGVGMVMEMDWSKLIEATFCGAFPSMAAETERLSHRPRGGKIKSGCGDDFFRSGDEAWMRSTLSATFHQQDKVTFYQHGGSPPPACQHRHACTDRHAHVTICARFSLGAVRVQTNDKTGRFPQLKQSSHAPRPGPHGLESPDSRPNPAPSPSDRALAAPHVAPSVIGIIAQPVRDGAHGATGFSHCSCSRGQPVRDSGAGQTPVDLGPEQAGCLHGWPRTGLPNRRPATCSLCSGTVQRESRVQDGAITAQAPDGRRPAQSAVTPLPGKEGDFGLLEGEGGTLGAHRVCG